jgi:hypothetical protein
LSSKIDADILRKFRISLEDIGGNYIISVRTKDMQQLLILTLVKRTSVLQISIIEEKDITRSKVYDYTKEAFNRVYEVIMENI